MIEGSYVVQELGGRGCNRCCLIIFLIVFDCNCSQSALSGSIPRVTMLIKGQNAVIRYALSCSTSPIHIPEAETYHCSQTPLQGTSVQSL